MPDPIEVQKLRIRAVAAATGALAEYGIPTDVTELLLIGDPAKRSFAVFYLKGGRLLGVEAVNAVPEYMFGKRMIAQRKQVAAARLADSGMTMKEIAA